MFGRTPQSTRYSKRAIPVITLFVVPGHALRFKTNDTGLFFLRMVCETHINQSNTTGSSDPLYKSTHIRCPSQRIFYPTRVGSQPFSPVSLSGLFPASQTRLASLSHMLHVQEWNWLRAFPESERPSHTTISGEPRYRITCDPLCI